MLKDEAIAQKKKKHFQLSKRDGLSNEQVLEFRDTRYIRRPKLFNDESGHFMFGSRFETSGGIVILLDVVKQLRFCERFTKITDYG